MLLSFNHTKNTPSRVDAILPHGNSVEQPSTCRANFLWNTHLFVKVAGFLLLTKNTSIGSIVPLHALNLGVEIRIGWETEFLMGHYTLGLKMG